MPDTTPDGGPPTPRQDAPPASRAHTQVVGDAALEQATGRPRTAWYALLDAAGAAGWPHRDIATWLVRDHGVDAWWAQGVTVGYEQERGTRVPGQRQDGSFEGSVSRVLPVDRQCAWAAVTDPALLADWLGVAVDVTGRTPPASVRWSLDDGTRAVVRVEEVRPGATRVVVQHARLPDADALAASKEAWRGRLARLAVVVTGR